MDNFLETQNLPRLNYEEIENLNGPMTSKEIESVIQDLLKKKTPGADGFTGKLHQIIKEKLISILLKVFPKQMKRKEHFYETEVTLIPRPKILQEN